jgi:hypothetical protein
MNGFTLGGDDDVYVNHGGLIRESDKAKLFWVRCKQLWIPKAVISTSDKKVLAVKKWWADKNGICGDW